MFLRRCCIENVFHSEYHIGIVCHVDIVCHGNNTNVYRYSFTCKSSNTQRLVATSAQISAPATHVAICTAAYIPIAPAQEDIAAPFTTGKRISAQRKPIKQSADCSSTRITLVLFFVVPRARIIAASMPDCMTARPGNSPDITTAIAAAIG